MKIIIIALITFLIWLNTYNVSNDFIIQQNWKNYDGYISEFKDVIIFKNSNRFYGLKLNINDSIFINDTLFLGKIIRKKHDYMNTFITVLDINNRKAIYIAK